MTRRPFFVGSAVLLLAACAGGSSGDAGHVEAMAREHARDAPTPSPAARAAGEVVTREVAYGTVDGEPVTGHLAQPVGATGGGLPGIVVIHGWWGLNDNIRAMTRRLAAEGYAALAVDMYGGEIAAEPAQARALMSRAMQRPEAGLENLRAAARYLRAEQGAERVGVLGWCFGGGWSLRAGARIPEQIDAVVMYYGQPITDPERLARLDAPLLGLLGADDGGIPASEVREMERVLSRLGKEAAIRVYPGVGHAFANPSGGNYDAETAEDAWRRTTEFLAEHLKGDG